MLAMVGEQDTLARVSMSAGVCVCVRACDCDKEEQVINKFER